MGWITIEEYDERLNVREERLMGEKPRITEIIPSNRKIIDKLENAVEAIKENEMFSVARVSKANGVSEGGLKKYIQLWCEENNKKLVSIVGKNGGSMIKSKED